MLLAENSGPMSRSTHTDAWIEYSQALGEHEFLVRHPGCFLLSSENLVEELSLSSVETTRIVDFAHVQKSRPRRRMVEVRWIARVEDSSSAPDTISVGRHRSCDICFLHPSVSKVHAQFLAQGGGLTLTDLGSKNGTRINGTLLVPNQPEPVAPHDRVQFGWLQTMVLEGSELFQLLSRMS
jgi:hypothetical protein